jgi:hypothetical protein
MSGKNVNVYFTERNLKKINPLLFQRKFSHFVNEAVAEKIAREKVNFRKQLISDYQSAAQDEELNAELTA